MHFGSPTGGPAPFSYAKRICVAFWLNTALKARHADDVSALICAFFAHKCQRFGR